MRLALYVNKSKTNIARLIEEGYEPVGIKVDLESLNLEVILYQ